MHFSHPRLRVLFWLVAAALPAPGCAFRTARVQDFSPPGVADSFGDIDTIPITEETVFGGEMIRQRAQAELRLGGTVPFDIFRPDVESQTDPGVTFGGKFAFEGFKNLFFGVAADWTHHDVDDPDRGIAGEDQIELINNYDQYSFLATADYDLPLTESPEGPVFRFGAGMGITWVKFAEKEPSTRNVESFVQFLFRPAVSLRFPVADNLLLFTEASYNLVPERSLETTETEVIDGNRPVFGGPTLWLGIAFEWD
ncbi:MAG: hypothetical protein O7J95_08410 [Planctomycetota bacterium]|nr:hypothetical protein [Planctomycetota bacterium]